MKYRVMVPVLVFLLLAGCAYESPFTSEHNIAIDPAVLGLWEPQADGDEESGQEGLMVLKYSDTEYLIHYPTGKDGIYYRGYPIKIGGIACVQLQVIGTHDGPPKKDEKKLFHAVSYRLTDSGLEIRTLNTELVEADLKTTEELRKAFLKHKGNKDLFKDPGVFRRMKE